MSKLRTYLLPTAATLTLILAACGGGGDSSGLATLADVEPEAEAVPESGEMATAGIVGSPPETTEDTTATTTETAPESADSTAAATVETTPESADSTSPATTGTAPDTADAATTISTTVGDGEPGYDPPATTTTQPESSATGAGSGQEDLTDEERLLEFADCMRTHGVDFPDPVVEADGTVRFGFRPGAGGAGELQELGRDPDLPEARAACEGLLQGLSFGPGSGNLNLTELQDTLLEFAQCMRDNGVDMGDPDLSAFGPGGRSDNPGGNPLGDIDFRDPDVAAALEVCQEQVNLGRFGRGGPRSNS